MDMSQGVNLVRVSMFSWGTDMVLYVVYTTARMGLDMDAVA